MVAMWRLFVWFRRERYQFTAARRTNQKNEKAPLSRGSFITSLRIGRMSLAGDRGAVQRIRAVGRGLVGLGLRGAGVGL